MERIVAAYVESGDAARCAQLGPSPVDDVSFVLTSTPSMLLFYCTHLCILSRCVFRIVSVLVLLFSRHRSLKSSIDVVYSLIRDMARRQAVNAEEEATFPEGELWR